MTSSSPIRPRPPGVDDLLADYLRIINEKDTEILALVEKAQCLETELRKTEERAKTRVKSLRESAGELQAEAEQAVRRLTDADLLVDTLQKERDELRADVETLRDAMYRQDHDLRQALRASERAQKTDAQAAQDLQIELDAKKREATDIVSSLENRLTSTTRQLRDSDEERNRVLKEAAALQSRLEDRENQIRELRRQRKTLVPKEDVDTELRAIEARANSEISAAMRELERMRAEHTEETHRGQRRDAVLGEAREECRRLEQQLNDARRVIHEGEMRAAQTQVNHAQRIEEMRADVAVAHDKIASLEAARQGLEQERSTLTIRTEETKRTFQNNEVSMRAELERLRDKNLESNAEVESLKRVIAQQDTMVQQSRDRAERIAEERSTEVRALRDDVQKFSNAAQQATHANQNQDRINATLREEMRREHDTRVQCEKQLAEIQSALASARHDKDMQSTELQTQATAVVELRRERDEQQIRLARADAAFREVQDEIRDLKSQIGMLHEEKHRLEQSGVADRAERSRLEGRASADTMTIQRLQTEVADRDSRLSGLESQMTTIDAQRAANVEEVTRLRTHIEHITGEHRREQSHNTDVVRRLNGEIEDVATRLSAAELSRDEMAKELAVLRSKDAQTQSLLQSRQHELSAATERAENAESIRSALDKQNEALRRQASELQARVDELRTSLDTMQLSFDKQAAQIEHYSRAREHQAAMAAGATPGAGGGAAGLNSTSAQHGAGGGASVGGGAAAASTPVHAGGYTAPGSPNRSHLGLDNMSNLPARGPSYFSSQGRGPFSPGMYSSVIAGPGHSASPAGHHYTSAAALTTQSSHVSPSRRGGGLSPHPRGY